MPTETLTVDTAAFGKLPDGRAASLFTVKTVAPGVQARFTDYGARVVSVEVPDAAGNVAGVVLGFDRVEDYVADQSFQGATIGRFGNRIANGRFTLDGVAYEIPQNNGPNVLHGGPDGFDRRLWHAEPMADGVVFKLTSPGGDQGFPGTLAVEVRYTFVASAGNVALRIEYTATCDQATIVNLTNHSYFNLAGESSGTILDQHVAIAAEGFTPVDENLIPTGVVATVEGTAFDLREPTTIGQHIDCDDLQLQRAGGYDHNFVLHDEAEAEGTSHAVVLSDPASGRVMSVETTEPAVQFYSGNFLDASMPNRKGGVYAFRHGLCLETQHFPDSPNHESFPSTILRPGETYRSVTTYHFAAKPTPTSTTTHQHEEA